MTAPLGVLRVRSRILDLIMMMCIAKWHIAQSSIHGMPMKLPCALRQYDCECDVLLRGFNSTA